MGYYSDASQPGRQKRLLKKLTTESAVHINLILSSVIDSEEWDIIGQPWSKTRLTTFDGAMHVKHMQITCTNPQNTSTPRLLHSYLRLGEWISLVLSSHHQLKVTVLFWQSPIIFQNGPKHSYSKKWRQAMSSNLSNTTSSIDMAFQDELYTTTVLSSWATLSLNSAENSELKTSLLQHIILRQTG